MRHDEAVLEEDDDRTYKCRDDVFGDSIAHACPICFVVTDISKSIPSEKRKTYQLFPCFVTQFRPTHQILFRRHLTLCFLSGKTSKSGTILLRPDQQDTLGFIDTKSKGIHERKTGTLISRRQTVLSIYSYRKGIPGSEKRGIHNRSVDFVEKLFSTPCLISIPAFPTPERSQRRRKEGKSPNTFPCQVV